MPVPPCIRVGESGNVEVTIELEDREKHVAIGKITADAVRVHITGARQKCGGSRSGGIGGIRCADWEMNSSRRLTPDVACDTLARSTLGCSEYVTNCSNVAAVAAATAVLCVLCVLQ